MTKHRYQSTTLLFPNGETIMTSKKLNGKVLIDPAKYVLPRKGQNPYNFCMYRFMRAGSARHAAVWLLRAEALK